jgi:hypothetical protein
MIFRIHDQEIQHMIVEKRQDSFDHEAVRNIEWYEGYMGGDEDIM